MDNLRREQLITSWEAERNDEMDWREDLTPEELDFVASLDKTCCRGMLAMATAILVMEKIRERFTPKEILELKAVRDHCRLTLRDGRMYLVRLDEDRFLRLDEIDEVC